MRCGNRRKFDADRSITKLAKNRQIMTSVYWRVSLKGLRVLPRYGPPQQIWLYTMRLCGIFGYALQATGANLICVTMGHSSRYGCMLWATAQNEVKVCNDSAPWAIAQDLNMGCNTVFSSTQWAVTQDFVLQHGPQCRNWLCTMGHSAKPISRVQKYTFFKSL
jgi:hypothetical protein